MLPLMIIVGITTYYKNIIFTNTIWFFMGVLLAIAYLLIIGKLYYYIEELCKEKLNIITNKFNILDTVKIKNQPDKYKIFAIQYYHNKGIIYELWRESDLKEIEMEEKFLEKV